MGLARTRPHPSRRDPMRSPFPFASAAVALALSLAFPSRAGRPRRPQGPRGEAPSPRGEAGRDDEGPRGAEGVARGSSPGTPKHRPRRGARPDTARPRLLRQHRTGELRNVVQPGDLGHRRRASTTTTTVRAARKGSFPAPTASRGRPWARGATSPAASTSARPSSPSPEPSIPTSTSRPSPPSPPTASGSKRPTGGPGACRRAWPSRRASSTATSATPTSSTRTSGTSSTRTSRTRSSWEGA